MATSRRVVQGWRLTTHVIQVLFASHLFLSYGYEIGPCLGPSMLPTINQSGDFILVEKWTHLSQRGYKSGDIVQGRHPYENHPVCKRIVGKVSLLVSRVTEGRRCYSYRYIDGTIYESSKGACLASGG
jgi:mitochondrial inner membrane protease subunit 1